METLYFENTETTPLVEGKSGHLLMKGKALPENVIPFFEPIFKWIREYDQPDIILDINLYYFNTSVSKQLHDLFQFVEANEKISAIKLNWHYEEGDEENLESGELYENTLKRTDFNYIEYAES